MSTLYIHQVLPIACVDSWPCTEDTICILHYTYHLCGSEKEMEHNEKQKKPLLEP